MEKKSSSSNSSSDYERRSRLEEVFIVFDLDQGGEIGREVRVRVRVTLTLILTLTLIDFSGAT